MRVRMSILLASLLVAALPGCKGKAEKMSEYSYFLKMLNNRWEIARKSFQSDKPKIGYAPVLLKDLSGAVDAMERTYTEPNSDQAIAKLKELNRKFKADMNAMVSTRSGKAELMPGATVKGVGEAIEKAYQEYQEFRKLVEE